MIYIIWAPPRQGKTFLATRIGVDAMTKKKNPRRVFSNYPIIDRKTGISSYVWTPEKTYENVNGSIIIIDEAYRNYNSRNYRGFSVDDHTWFATNGHLGNDIYLIAQNPARIDTVIREMTNEFIFVEKFHPFEFLDWRPSWFKMSVYLSYEEFTMMGRLEPYLMYRQLAWKRYADAYDTRYYRQEERGVHVTWNDYLKSQDINTTEGNYDMEVSSGASEGCPNEKDLETDKSGVLGLHPASGSKGGFMSGFYGRCRFISDLVSLRNRKINQENRK